MATRHPVTAEQYASACKRRFGTGNPERIHNPVWEWMMREGHNPYSARTELGLKLDLSSWKNKANPDWCFVRMGMATVTLDDGRRVSIAGEHEDFYDPDFCIYNDVIVRTGDEVEIYGYPKDVFPPTDFHSATIIADQIWLIGSIGYPDERDGESTQVLLLDCASLCVSAAELRGDSPGWISKHRARLLDDGTTIEISGGTVFRHEGGEERWRKNLDVYHLDTPTGTWTKMTDTSSWRQFRVAVDEDFADENAMQEMQNWYTGEILEDLGYPLELSPELTREGFDEDEEDDLERVHTVLVDGVPVRVIDSYGEVHLTIEGPIKQSVVESLLTSIRSLAESTLRTVTSVEEL